MNISKLRILKNNLRKLYLTRGRKLLFHGWHHIHFVSKKATEFAKHINADAFLVESAAFVHDLNYIVKPNSEPEAGSSMRKMFLAKAGYSENEIKRIEKIIMESHTRTRTKKISKEGMALSDADTLFKALPVTPILFAGKYILESNVYIRQLAKKVSQEQNRLMNQGIYFYTSFAKRNYLQWAKTNLALWNNVNDSLKNKDVIEMLKLSGIKL